MGGQFFSHFIAFTAFIQLTVAFNFGLLYIERKSSMVKFRDLFHDGYLSFIDIPLKAGGREMKRYREKNATDEEREAYYNVRDLRTELTCKTNELIHFKFLQSLGMIYGIWGIIQLFFICMLDWGIFYVDFFLISGQMTFIYSMIIFICLLLQKGTNPHILTTAILYFIVLIGCYIFITQDWILHCIAENDVSLCFHCFFLMSYLPFVSYLYCSGIIISGVFLYYGNSLKALKHCMN